VCYCKGRRIRVIRVIRTYDEDPAAAPSSSSVFSAPGRESLRRANSAACPKLGLLIGANLRALRNLSFSGLLCSWGEKGMLCDTGREEHVV
jgi:hypothetical protein